MSIVMIPISNVFQMSRWSVRYHQNTALGIPGSNQAGYQSNEIYKEFLVTSTFPW